MDLESGQLKTLEILNANVHHILFFYFIVGAYNIRNTSVVLFVFSQLV